MKAVILAGGSGERFWPLSTRETPKQFLELFGSSSLLEQTCDRLRERFEPEDIFVITSKKHAERTRELLSDLPPENIVGEPMKRNTAAACVIGALLSEKDEIQLVVPADHRIPDHGSFWKAFNIALSGISEIGGLFTFGIEPTRADTGYGYIESGDEVRKGIFRVKRFLEKPDEKTAKILLEKGDHHWNSGMFLWRSSDLLSEIEKCSPDIFKPMTDMDPHDEAQMERIYPNIPARSIDHAVMEISQEVRMVKGSFAWSDVGNWSSIQELEGYSSDGKDGVLIDSKRIFIRSVKDRPIGVIGLEGIVIIETENGLLVCSEDQVQKVREISKRLNKDP